MKSLQLNPPLLIVTMGYPGAGKTFFARQFGTEYGLPVISEERFRFELFENPRFNSDEQEIIDRMINYNLEQVFVTESSVIIDGNYSDSKRRKELFENAKQAGYRCLTVWLQTDMTTSFNRAKNRDRRNTDSKFAFSIDQNTFQQVCAQVNRPSEKEAHVVISGKHAFKGQSLSVLRKITEIYANNLSFGSTVRAKAQIRPKSSRYLIQ